MSSPTSPSVWVYRVLHVTDVHFYTRPRLRELWAEPKRWIGLLNAELLGRRRRFDLEVQRSLVREVQRHRPSHLVVSGDLTSFATEAEFDTARRALQPQLGKGRSWTELGSSAQRTAGEEADEVGHVSVAGGGGGVAAVPHRTLVIPGNHDVYTFESARQRLFDRYFGAWRPPTGRLLRWDDAAQKETEGAEGGADAGAESDAGLHVLLMDPCQPNRVSSHGHFDERQLSSVSSALSSFAALRSPSFLLLLCHYPLLSPTGGDYGAAHPWHGVDNGHRMLHVLNTGLASASHPLHAAALLHGHVHKGYRAELPLHPPSPLLSWSMPTLNPGSSGRSFSQQHQRAAAYNLYTIAWTPQRAAEAAATATDTAQPLQAAAQPDEPSAASGRWTLQVERFVHDGSAFQREPTAYTSGY